MKFSPQVLWVSCENGIESGKLRSQQELPYYGALMIQILVKGKKREEEKKKETVNDDIRTPDPTTVTLHAITKENSW